MLHIETKNPVMNLRMSSRFGVCLNFYRGLERKGLNSNSQVTKFGSLQLGCNLISKIHERKSPWRCAPQAGNKRDSWTRGTDRSTDSAFCRFSNETFYPILCKFTNGQWQNIQHFLHVQILHIMVLNFEGMNLTFSEIMAELSKAENIIPNFPQVLKVFGIFIISLQW